MAVTVEVWDEAVPAGHHTRAESVALPAARTTAREIIRSRVRQEVERYNEAMPEVFRGLVQPEESEQILNGFRMATRRRLEWETQCERAYASFARNGFLILVDGQQVVDLDAELLIEPGAQVQFVKLVPLMGG